MNLILIDNLPYVLGNNNTMYACEITALKITVDNHEMKAPTKIESIYTLDNIRSCLGIKIVDGWDKENNVVIKTSNRKVSSMGIGIGINTKFNSGI